ncbi:hypothetical protein [Nocardia arizonensis]|nr:hypothetical protein [Nocardia arizonensis]
MTTSNPPVLSAETVAAARLLPAQMDISPTDLVTPRRRGADVR